MAVSVSFILENISLILVSLIVFLVCYIYLNRGKKTLPGPKGLPLIGSPSFLIARSVRLSHKLSAAGKIYGDIFSVKIGWYNFVFVNGYENIHDVFVKQAAEFSDRPSFLVKFAVQEGKGVIWQSGQTWKIMRRFTLQTLRDFGVGKTSIEQKIFQEIDAASKLFQDSNGAPTDVKMITAMMISNVIYGIVFGKRFSYDDTFFHELQHRLDTIFKSGSLLSPALLLPQFICRVVAKQELEVQLERRETLQWIKDHIYKAIKEHEDSFDPDNKRDFIDLYIETARANKDCAKDGFNHGNIFRVIMDLFIAGSETTSNTINWCILYLMEKPEVQKRCFEEIQQIYGDRAVLWEDKGKCPYVEATLLEIQRLANIAPLSVPHTNSAEAKINGYTVPKTSIVIANLWSSNMDPKHWDQPEVFRPERFLGEDGKIKKNPALVPFSIGPRICMGESLAKMEMFLIFTNLIQRFEFRREKGAVPHDMEPRLDQATSAPKPYKVCAFKRHQ